jgi:penicillin-binding protein 2
MALATSVVANGGIVHRPHLVERVEDAAGASVYEPGEEVRRVEVPAEILAVVRQGMREAVTSGTARSAWSRLPAQVAIAGKTGTAEFADPVFTEDGVYPRRDKDGNLLTHAWFVAFAPYEAPELAVAVFIDGSGLDRIIEGSQVAAPVAAEVFRQWFGITEPTPPPSPSPGGETAGPAPTAGNAP